MAGAPHPLLPAVGDLFAERYDVRRCLRAGGMGAVYEVHDRRTGWARALKVLLPSYAVDPGARERFVLEASATANLSSPHLVQVVDADVSNEGGCPYLVMELLEGEDLGARLAREGALPLDSALAILQDVAAGLETLHAADVVHRDLKPENVFLRTDAATERAVLIDLGVAKLVAETTQQAPTTLALGTPLYMPCEQVEGDGSIDHRADLYALGQLAYTMCVGHAYFVAEARAGTLLRVLLQQGVGDAASLRARRHGVSLSPAFDLWFAKATARRRGARFAAAGEQIAALRRISEAGSRAGGSTRRRITAATALGTTLALVAASFALAARRSSSTEPLVAPPSPPAAVPPTVASTDLDRAPLTSVLSPPSAAPSVSVAPAATSVRGRLVPAREGREPPPRSPEPAAPAAPPAAPPADPSDLRR